MKENKRLGKESGSAKIECQKLREECKELQTENQTLKDSIKQKLGEESLRNNDSKVKYYTGLPSFMTLMAVFVCCFAPKG